MHSRIRIYVYSSLYISFRRHSISIQTTWATLEASPIGVRREAATSHDDGSKRVGRAVRRRDTRHIAGSRQRSSTNNTNDARGREDGDEDVADREDARRDTRQVEVAVAHLRSGGGGSATQAMRAAAGRDSSANRSCSSARHRRGGRSAQGGASHPRSGRGFAIASRQDRRTGASQQNSE